MLILAAKPKKGGTTCSSACPFYQETGEVRCFGGVKQTHCRMIMQPYFVDCNQFDVTTMQVINTSDDTWQKMLDSVGIKKTKKKRKLYKPNRKSPVPICK